MIRERIKHWLQKRLEVPRRCDVCYGFYVNLAEIKFPNGDDAQVCSSCWRELTSNVEKKRIVTAPTFEEIQHYMPNLDLEHELSRKYGVV